MTKGINLLIPANNQAIKFEEILLNKSIKAVFDSQVVRLDVSAPRVVRLDVSVREWSG